MIRRPSAGMRSHFDVVLLVGLGVLIIEVAFLTRSAG
jgi:hypothetical protein